MRILIAGVAGFIGTNLAARLLDDGHTVIGLDNFCTGSKANVEYLNSLGHDFVFIEYDICNPMKRFGRFNEVYNLACPASPPKYQAMPVETMMTCVLGTKNLLDLAKSCDASFFQASTSEVYGDPELSPQRESYRGVVNCFGPRACYDEGKRAAEALCFDYANMGTRVSIGRLFNTYGPRMDIDDGRVVTNFIKQALADEDLTIYGSGDQTRSLCYVYDTVSAIIALNRSYIAQPCNIGNPEEVTVLELAHEIIAMTSSDSSISHKSLPVDDPTQRKPDISLIESIDWRPTVTRHEGLQLTIEYFQS